MPCIQFKGISQAIKKTTSPYHTWGWYWFLGDLIGSNLNNRTIGCTFGQIIYGSNICLNNNDADQER
jgi:hypothetical protein